MPVQVGDRTPYRFVRRKTLEARGGQPVAITLKPALPTVELGSSADANRGPDA